MSAQEVAPIIAALLSVGSATLLYTFIKGILALRAGAAGREKDAWTQLKEHNQYLDDTRRVAEADRDYYHSICMKYYGQLVRAGQEPDPPRLRPPSERTRERKPQHRSGVVPLPVEMDTSGDIYTG